MRVAFSILVGLLVYGVSANEQKIVCYFGSWAVYRPGNGGINIEDIDPNLCTHLIYTFVGLEEQGGIRILDPWADLPDGGGRDGFNRFNKLRGQNPNTKTLIAIGGWNEGSSKYSRVAASPQTRQAFADNAVKFVRKYGFDGFDFDWEYPNQRGGVPEDKENYVLLLKELRERFDEAGLLLSAAVGAAQPSASLSYIIPEIVKYLDFINLMAYDFHGVWDKKTGINAPLFPSSSEKGNETLLNVYASVDYWLSQGAPREKLILGIPLYGRSFTLDNVQNNGIGAPAAQPGKAGPYTRQDGTIGYNEICEMQLNEDWDIHFEEEQKVPYAVKDNQWIGYEDPRSVHHKALFIMNFGLGGAMVWSIETDDFKGICGPKYPLLKALNDVLREPSTTRLPSTVTEPTTSSRPSTTTSGPSTTVTVPATSSTPSTTISGHSTTVTAKKKKIVCYFGSWAVYRPGNGGINIEDIDTNLCTHLIYTFVGLEEQGGIRILDPWADLPDGGGRDGFNRFNKLRGQNPNTKTLIAIGGWNEGSSKYSRVAASIQTRKAFADNAVKFVRKYGFDGFDFDWEYPNQRGGVLEDKENYVLLLKELREQFDEAGLLLSAAVGAAQSSASLSYIIPEVVKYLDFVNLMAYDFHGAWDKKTGINAPLFASSSEKGNEALLNVNASVNYWLSQGAPREKLILGIPLYGRSFTLDSIQNNSIGAPAAQPGKAGPYTQQEGTIGYNEVCEMQLHEDWDIHFEEEQKVPYAVKDTQWIGYENPRSVHHKAQFIMNLGLGGAMIWSIETDDFKGICGPKYPLLKTLNDVLREPSTTRPSTTVTKPTSSSRPSTTTSGPSTTTSVPSTTATGLTTSSESSTTTSRPSTTVTDSTTSSRPSTTSSGSSTTVTRPTTSSRPSTTTTRPSTTVTGSTTSSRPSTTASVPSTTVTGPTSSSRPSTMTSEPSTTVTVPTTLTSPSTTTRRTTTSRPPTSTTEGQHCGVTCKGPGFIRDPKDCSVFYRCVMDPQEGYRKVKFVCPNGLVFNTKLNVCDWPSAVDCSVSR